MYADIAFRKVELDMYFSKYAQRENSDFLKSDLTVLEPVESLENEG